MNCVVCDLELAKWELPQPVNVGGHPFMPPAICSSCARENLTEAGSPESLDRLVAGKADPEAAAELRAATPTPWDTP